MNGAEGGSAQVSVSDKMRPGIVGATEGSFDDDGKDSTMKEEHE